MASVCLIAPFESKLQIASEHCEYEAVFAAFGDEEKNRIDKISRYECAMLSFGGLLCLKRLTDRYLPCRAHLTLKRESSGKPYFKDKTLGEFNISHSSKLAVAVYSQHGELGIDIELLDARKSIDGIAERFLGEEERDYIADAPDKTLAFYKLWTAKEALVKATGAGLSSLARTNVLSQNGRNFHQFSVRYADADYLMTVCTALGDDVEIINDNGGIEIYEIPYGI